MGKVIFLATMMKQICLLNMFVTYQQPYFVSLIELPDLHNDLHFSTDDVYSVLCWVMFSSQKSYMECWNLRTGTNDNLQERFRNILVSESK